MRFILLLLLFVCTSASAHKSSDSYLKVSSDQQGTAIQWEIAIRDLENVMLLDFNNDGSIAWGELQAREDQIYQYANDNLDLISNEERCSLNSKSMQLNKYSDGAYVVLNFDTPCVVEQNSIINYRLFFDVDAQHRGLLNLTINAVQTSYLFSPNNVQFKYAVEMNDAWNSFYQFINQGVWHIWIGYDHILFLISLLLPAVLVRENKNWKASEDFKDSLIDVTKIVTAFTIAHSLTLSLMILANLNISVSLVESLIALSVIIVALNNCFSILNINRSYFAFGFGLIHGFGFANVLSELELENQSLFYSLLGFNLGVEIGQLLIVIIFLPIAFELRKKWIYQTLLFKYGSFVVAILGMIWLVERSSQLI